jgi:beta-lactam-binding protein with PASTA domain
VRRDVPEEIEELEQKELAQKEKEKSREKGRAHEVADEDTVAGLATPLTLEEATAATGNSDLTARAEQNLTGPKVPNFVGKTVQSVMEEAAQNGIEVDMLGQGMARAQSPPAGALIVPGEHILVRFAR